MIARYSLVFVAALAGCHVHASAFRLTGFSADEHAAIESAAELWSAAGYPTVIKPDGDGAIIKLPFCGDLQDGEVVGYDGCHVVGQASEWIVLIDNADVRAAFPADSWLSHVRMVAAHELGHYHGFPDTRQQGHVMTWVAQERGEILP